MNVVNAGTITLGCTCDVTDPCYNADVWCRHTVTVKPGIYNCFLEISDEGDWGNRVKRSWIIHEDIADIKGLRKSFTCECGVDAGLLGYFDNKPDFTDEEWESLCDSINWDDKFVIDQFRGRDGFFTASGYGDGCYDITVYKKKGENVAIEAVFI